MNDTVTISRADWDKMTSWLASIGSNMIEAVTVGSEVKAQIARLRAVARAADDWRLSNDVSDELHDALDNLQPGDC